MIKAVIFDLDGTVTNTMPLCIRAFREALEPVAWLEKRIADETADDIHGYNRDEARRDD